MQYGIKSRPYLVFLYVFFLCGEYTIHWRRSVVVSALASINELIDTGSG